MKKLLAFDLDGTLTQHRTPINDENRDLLVELGKKYRVIMLGAGDAKRIYNQLRGLDVEIIGNYGMQYGREVDGEFRLLKDEKTTVDEKFFSDQAEYLRKKYGYTDYKGDSVIFHSSGMVTIPLLGSDADIKDKIAFDPDRSKRKVLFPEVCEIFSDYTVYIGGSSSFDISEKRYNKYTALKTFAEENGFTTDEVLFIGDDFGDGGGDSHIRIYGIDYVEITDYTKIKEKLSFLL